MYKLLWGAQGAPGAPQPKTPHCHNLMLGTLLLVIPRFCMVLCPVYVIYYIHIYVCAPSWCPVAREVAMWRMVNEASVQRRSVHRGSAGHVLLSPYGYVFLSCKFLL